VLDVSLELLMSRVELQSENRPGVAVPREAVFVLIFIKSIKANVNLGCWLSRIETSVVSFERG
jgi:hypothetical protein